MVQCLQLFVDVCLGICYLIIILWFVFIANTNDCPSRSGFQSVKCPYNTQGKCKLCKTYFSTLQMVRRALNSHAGGKKVKLHDIVQIFLKPATQPTCSWKECSLGSTQRSKDVEETSVSKSK